MDNPQRSSIISQTSQFSFENGKAIGEERTLTVPVDHKNSYSSLVRSQQIDETDSTSLKQSSNIDDIIKQNKELQRTNLEQEKLISLLRLEIVELTKQLNEKETTIQSTSEIAAKTVDLILPPRSANRLRSRQGTPVTHKHNISPIITRDKSIEERDGKTDFEQDEQREEEENLEATLENIHHQSINGTEPLEDLELPQKNFTEDRNISEDPQIKTHDDDAAAAATTANTINIKFSTPPTANGELSTPLSSNSNIDWNAAMQALSSSPEEVRISTPKSLKFDQNKSQSTPYSGRIQIKSNNHTPSPVKIGLSPVATYNDPNQPDAIRSPARSMISTSKMSLNLNQDLSTPVSISTGSYPQQQQQSHSKSKLNETPLLTQNRYQDHIDFGDAPSPVIHQLPQQSIEKQQKLFRYPSDIPLFVEPHQLATVRPEIITTINGNPTKKSDDPSIIIAAFDRQTNKEMWRFKKALSQILLLDNETRPLINSFSLPPVPEKSLFLTNVPTKVDLRRSRLRDYFFALFSIPNIPLEVSYKISRFMSLDIVNLLDESNTEVYKDGWLLRRTTKGLSTTWKARYCEIDQGTMNIFENPNNQFLEQILLTGAQIGRQPDNLKHTDDKSAYRHAFAIMEPKKGKSQGFIKHIFCAETDQERDLWINVLLQFTEDPSTPTSSKFLESGDLSNSSSKTLTIPLNITSEHSESFNSTRSSPIKTHTRNGSRSTNNETDDDELSSLATSRDAKKHKKRSFFPFGKRTNGDEPNDQESASLSNFSNTTSNKRVSSFFMGSSAVSASLPSSAAESNIEKQLQTMNLSQDNLSITNNVFANDLAEVLSLSSHELFGQKIPSVMYRCIIYLVDTNAVEEEGLFRLSGSAALIKQLREQFDKDYDVDFKKLSPRPDINTIAGLFKLWLRELPYNILTNELLPSYKAYYNNIKDAKELSLSYRQLTIEKLPTINRNVLYVLFKFLNDVLQNKQFNKMNLRNLCIVFSPTLNIPAEVLTPFLVDFKCIFENGDPIDDGGREILDVNIPTF